VDEYQYQSRQWYGLALSAVPVGTVVKFHPETAHNSARGILEALINVDRLKPLVWFGDYSCARPDPC